MNIKQLQYAVQLSEIRSFSQLAEKLDISQPALSKHIHSLETELGVKLFDRNSIPLTLTPAGEDFISQARQLIYKESQLVRSMERYRSGEAGKLTIGISPFRSQYLIPGVLAKVKKKFPYIKIVVQEQGSEDLRKEAIEGKYDFAVVNLPVNEAVLDVIPMEADRLVLAVPDKYIDLIGNGISQSEDKSSLKELSFKDCAGLPFVVVGQTQEMRILFDKLCASSDIDPQIAAEVTGITTARTMCYEGIGATLLPLQFIKSDLMSREVTLFALKDNTDIRQPAVVIRRGSYLSECAKYAIELLTKE